MRELRALLRQIRANELGGCGENSPKGIDVAVAPFLSVSEEPGPLVVEDGDALERFRHLSLEAKQFGEFGSDRFPVRVRHRPVERTHRGKRADVLQRARCAVGELVLKIR